MVYWLCQRTNFPTYQFPNLPIFPKLRDNASNVLSAFQVQVKPDVLIGGVSVGARMPYPRRHYRQIQIVHESVIGARASNHGIKFHGDAIDLFRGIYHSLHKRIVGVGAGCGAAAQEFDFHIGEAFRV